MSKSNLNSAYSITRSQLIKIIPTKINIDLHIKKILMLSLIFIIFGCDEKESNPSDQKAEGNSVTLSQLSPKNEAKNLPLDTNITVKLNKLFVDTSYNALEISLETSQGEPVDGNQIYNENNNSIEFTPVNLLEESSRYKITINIDSKQIVSSFTTASISTPKRNEISGSIFYESDTPDVGNFIFLSGSLYIIKSDNWNEFFYTLSPDGDINDASNLQLVASQEIIEKFELLKTDIDAQGVYRIFLTSGSYTFCSVNLGNRNNPTTKLIDGCVSGIDVSDKTTQLNFTSGEIGFSFSQNP